MAIVVGMGLWLFSGDFTAETADAAEPSQRLDSVSQKVLVQGLQSKAAQRAVEIEVLGKTEANRQVFVRAELSGAITEVNAERGEFIEAGEALCKIAVDNREVRVQEAEAAYQSAMIEYQGALDLSASGLQSKVMLAKLKAAAVQAKSSLQTAKLNLDKTIIRAPFSGFVEDRQVEVGDLVTPGTACASILEISPLLVVG
jgi:multidrug efflux system membrane fusion protein